MEERRKNVRTELSASILLEGIGQETKGTEEITIIDVSKNGMGFTCNTRLQINAIYETDITLWTKEVIHTFLRIVRCEGNEYGAVFVGLAQMDAARIGVYQTFEEYGE